MKKRGSADAVQREQNAQGVMVPVLHVLVRVQALSPGVVLMVVVWD